MASQLIFASAEPEPRSSLPSLSPTQSLAVVESFINAFVACICFKRELLPWKSNCFKTRYLDDLYSHLEQSSPDPYISFTETPPSPHTGRSQEFRILKRGEDIRADKILDLIEKGIFPAIEGGFLDALRFYVTQSSTSSSVTDVLESYTLDFSYDPSLDRRNLIRSVSVRTSALFDLEITSSNFRKAIQNLIRSLDGCSRLPRKRSLGITMLYTKDCPVSYEAPGFLTENLILAAKELSGWRSLLLQPSSEIGEFEIRPYRMVLGASHAMPTEPVTSSQIRDQITSKKLQSLQKSSSYNQTGLLSTQDDPGSHRAPAINNSSSVTKSPSPSSQLMSRSSGKKNRGTNTAPQVMTSKTRKRNIVPQKLAELIEQAYALEADQEDNIFDLEDLIENNKLTRLDSHLGDVMNCDCGDKDNRGDLLLCRLCGTSQHMVCYGWKGISLVRLPDEHFCYSCLLSPEEQTLKDEMPSIVHKRLALVCIKKRRSVTTNELMLAMRLSAKSKDGHNNFKVTIDELQHEGLVQKQGTRFVTTMDYESAAAALRDYINPLARISHHFIAIQDKETSATRANAIAVAVKEHQASRQYQSSQESVNDNTPVMDRSRASHDSHLSNMKHKRKATEAPSTEAIPIAKRLRPSIDIDNSQPGQSKRLTRTSRNEAMLPVNDDENATQSPTPSSVRSTGRRKVSHCEQLVSLDRSSPSTVFDEDEVLAEAVDEAVSHMQWKLYGGRV